MFRLVNIRQIWIPKAILKWIWRDSVLSLLEPRQGSGLLCSRIRGRVSSAVSPSTDVRLVWVRSCDRLWQWHDVALTLSLSLSVLLLFPVVECHWRPLIAGAARRHSMGWFWWCLFIAVVLWVVVLFLVECGGYFALCGLYFSLSFYRRSSSVLVCILCFGGFGVCFVYVSFHLIAICNGERSWTLFTRRSEIVLLVDSTLMFTKSVRIFKECIQFLW